MPPCPALRSYFNEWQIVIVMEYLEEGRLQLKKLSPERLFLTDASQVT